MRPQSKSIINLPGFEILEVIESEYLEFKVKYSELNNCIKCIHCDSTKLRKKDIFIRRVKHVSIGKRLTMLLIKSHKFKYLNCEKYFNQRFPRIYLRKRATESFREEVYLEHSDGVSKKTTSIRFRVGEATVERWSPDHLKFAESKQDRSRWSRVIGIDEHFFTREKSFATTFADLEKNKVYDVTLGRSNKALEPYFRRSN